MPSQAVTHPAPPFPALCLLAMTLRSGKEMESTYRYRLSSRGPLAAYVAAFVDALASLANRGVSCAEDGLLIFPPRRSLTVSDPNPPLPPRGSPWLSMPCQC